MGENVGNLWVLMINCSLLFLRIDSSLLGIGFCLLLGSDSRGSFCPHSNGLLVARVIVRVVLVVNFRENLAFPLAQLLDIAYFSLVVLLTSHLLVILRVFI